MNWSEWETMGDSQVAPIIDNRGQSLFIAVDCSNRNVNFTNSDGNWRGWESLNALTKDLTKDRCNQVECSKIQDSGETSKEYDEYETFQELHDAYFNGIQLY